MRHQESSSIREYLKQREDTGKVIIHNLIEPSYNMLALTKELKGMSADTKLDASSVNLMINLAEGILSQVINLHDISFDNERLVFISVFDVQEVVRHLLKSYSLKSDEQQPVLLEIDEVLQVMGDKELTRFWIDAVLVLLREIYGGNIDCRITIGNRNESSVIIKMVVNGEANYDVESAFLDRAHHIDYVTRLLRGEVSLKGHNESLEITMEIPKDASMANWQ